MKHSIQKVSIEFSERTSLKNLSFWQKVRYALTGQLNDNLKIRVSFIREEDGATDVLLNWTYVTFNDKIDFQFNAPEDECRELFVTRH